MSSMVVAHCRDLLGMKHIPTHTNFAYHQRWGLHEQVFTNMNATVTGGEHSGGVLRNLQMCKYLVVLENS